MPDAAAPPPRLGILNGVGAAGAAGVRLPRALSAITAAPSTPNHAAVPAHRQAGGRAAKAPPPSPSRRGTPVVGTVAAPGGSDSDGRKLSRLKTQNAAAALPDRQ